MPKTLDEPILLTRPKPDQVEYLQDLVDKLKMSKSDMKRVIGNPKKRHNE